MIGYRAGIGLHAGHPGRRHADGNSSAGQQAEKAAAGAGNRSTFERLWELFEAHKGDRKVAFVIEERDRGIKVTADVSGIRVRPSERLVTEVEKICGAGSVSLR